MTCSNGERRHRDRHWRTSRHPPGFPQLQDARFKTRSVMGQGAQPPPTARCIDVAQSTLRCNRHHRRCLESRILELGETWGVSGSSPMPAQCAAVAIQASRCALAVSRTQRGALGAPMAHRAILTLTHSCAIHAATIKRSGHKTEDAWRVSRHPPGTTPALPKAARNAKRHARPRQPR